MGFILFIFFFNSFLGIWRVPVRILWSLKFYRQYITLGKVRRINKKRTFDKFSYISIEYMCELPANFQEHPKDDGGQARVYLLAERNVSFDLLGKFQLLAKKLKK